MVSGETNGFRGNSLGRNVRNDRGIISGFHNHNDFDRSFTSQSPCFPENINVHVTSLNCLLTFLQKTVMGTFYFPRPKNMTPHDLSKQIYPIDFTGVHRFLWIS
jgi:hypothetical protein